jgi:hypothetical protein
MFNIFKTFEVQLFGHATTRVHLTACKTNILSFGNLYPEIIDMLNQCIKDVDESDLNSQVDVINTGLIENGAYLFKIHITVRKYYIDEHLCCDYRIESYKNYIPVTTRLMEFFTSYLYGK